MKILVVFSCALAAASAVYQGPIHVPVIGPNGVPVDTPEVQHARASHYAALSEAAARAGPSGHYDEGAEAYSGGLAGPSPYSGGLAGVGVYAGGLAGANLYSVAPAQGRSPHANDPFYGLGPDGRPLDTPEVAAAKLHHQQVFVAEAQRNSVPISPLAHQGIAGGLHYRRRRAIYPQHVPVIGPGGVPVDTPEVQHARAAHYAALAAASRHSGYASPYYGSASVPVISHNALQAYAAPSGPYGYHGPQAQIGPDGHPVETHEVQLAKAAHFAAHAQALTRHY